MASYSAVIDLRVNGLRGLKTIEDRVKAIQNIQKELKPIPGIFDKRTTTELKKAKEELSKYVNEVGKGAKSGQNFSKTLAGLNAQMRAFSTVAANANVGSDEFINGLRAAERASIELKKAEIERLRVQSDFYKAKTVGRSTATQEILNLGKNIPKSIAGLDLYQQQLEETLRLVVAGSDDYLALSRAIAQVNRQLAIAQGLGPVQGPALPPGFTEAGATGFPRSPLSARPRQAAGRRGGNVLVGAAFPALFGAGPAGILGGAIGEAFGPLGGVVGSALGAPVDAFVAKTVEAGQALNSTSSALDFVRENSLFSSKATEELAYQLEELGDVEGVASLLTEELSDKIGNKGVEALQNLGDESAETTRLWNELTLQLQALIAGPLTAFLQLLNAVLRTDVNRLRFEALERDLAGNEKFEKAVRARRGGGKTGQLSPKDRQELLNLATEGRFGPLPRTAQVSITQQDRRNFDRKQANDTKRAAREAQRIALAVLNLNTALLQENLKQFDLKTRYMALSLEEIDRLTEANYRLDERFELEKQLLEKQREQALAKDPANEYLINKLYNERRDTAQGIVELAKFENQEKIKQLQAAERLAAIERRTGVAFGALLSESGMFTEDPLLGRAESPLAFGTGAQMQGLINQELALERIIEKYTEIGEAASLASELVTFGIMDMVSGTRSAEEVFAEFLQNIADMLLRTAATMIAQYIALGIARAFALGQTARVGPEMFNLGNTSFFGNAPALGGLGFRANGGPVSAGQSYIVGERGPELFVPKGSGTIVPNDRLGGGVTVGTISIKVENTGEQLTPAAQKQLAGQVQGIVLSTLANERRSGGML